MMTSSVATCELQAHFHTNKQEKKQKQYAQELKVLTEL